MARLCLFVLGNWPFSDSISRLTCLLPCQDVIGVKLPGHRKGLLAAVRRLRAAGGRQEKEPQPQEVRGRDFARQSCRAWNQDQDLADFR